MEAVMTGPESLMVPSRSKRTAVGRIGARPVVGAVRAGAVELGVTRLPVLGDGGIPPGSHLPPDLAMMPVTPAPTIGYCDVHNSIRRLRAAGEPRVTRAPKRSEEHTSELQSRGHLVCRLLLEKKKQIEQQANQS